jgi:hypothetical protein
VPETPHDALCRLTATEAVLRLKRREITPLDLIAAAARRIAQVEPGPVAERIERKGGLVICTVEPQSGPATIHRCAHKRIHCPLCWL